MWLGWGLGGRGFPRDWWDPLKYSVKSFIEPHLADSSQDLIYSLFQFQWPWCLLSNLVLTSHLCNVGFKSFILQTGISGSERLEIKVHLWFAGKSQDSSPGLSDSRAWILHQGELGCDFMSYSCITASVGSSWWRVGLGKRRLLKERKWWIVLSLLCSEDKT